MSEEKGLNPLVMLIGGLVLAVLAVGMMLLLLRETPESVVRDFYGCKNVDQQSMLLTSESAMLLSDRIAYQARYYGMSEAALKREYGKYGPQLKEITSIEKIDAVCNEWRFDCLISVPDQKGGFNDETQTLYVIKVNDTWKIDLTRSR